MEMNTYVDKQIFDFNNQYILENNLVKLTSLSKEDYVNLIDFAKNEPELWSHSLIEASSPEKLKIYIDKALKARENKNSYTFVIFNKLKNKYVGSTRYYDIQLKNASLSIGYTWYGKEFQGTGINQNCKYLLLEFAFEILKMERVEFRADTKNERSINAMKNIGCIEEGVLRSNAYNKNGERRNSIVMSILKDEWFKSVKEKLKQKLHDSI